MMDAGMFIAEAGQCMICCPQPEASEALWPYFLLGVLGGLVVHLVFRHLGHD